MLFFIPTVYAQDLNSRLVELVAQNDIEALRNFIVRLESDAERNSARGIVLSKLREEFNTAQKAEKFTRTFRALGALIMIASPSLRGELITNFSSLQSLLNSDPTAFEPRLPEDVLLEQHLLEVSGTHAALRSEMLTLYRELTLKAVISGDEDWARGGFRVLSELWTNERETKLEFQKELVLSAKKGASAQFIRSLIKELQAEGRLSVGLKFRLLLKGFYGKAPLLGLGCVCVLFLGGAFFFLTRPQGYLRSVLGALETVKEDNANRVAVQRGVGYRNVTDSSDEYSDLLEYFGLDDTATEADIKRAYRDAVKTHHPDMQNAEVDSQFQEIQKVYERILEVRKGWFSGRKPKV